MLSPVSFHGRPRSAINYIQQQQHLRVRYAAFFIHGCKEEALSRKIRSCVVALHAQRCFFRFFHSSLPHALPLPSLSLSSDGHRLFRRLALTIVGAVSLATLHTLSRHRFVAGFVLVFGDPTTRQKINGLQTRRQIPRRRPAVLAPLLRSFLFSHRQRAPHHAQAREGV